MGSFSYVTSEGEREKSSENMRERKRHRNYFRNRRANEGKMNKKSVEEKNIHNYNTKCVSFSHHTKDKLVEVCLCVYVCVCVCERERERERREFHLTCD